MTWIRNKIFNIGWWLYFNSPIYVEFNWFDIFKEYWKARKDYKFPKIRVQKYYRLRRVWFDLFSIIVRPLDYKTKCGDYISFENEPYILINLFGFAFRIALLSPNGEEHMYWESMLEYIYEHNCDIESTVANWGWQKLVYYIEDGFVYPYYVMHWDNSILRKGVEYDKSPQKIPYYLYD